MPSDPPAIWKEIRWDLVLFTGGVLVAIYVAFLLLPWAIVSCVRSGTAAWAFFCNGGRC